MLKFTHLCNFQRALDKSNILKVVAQAFEAGHSLNISFHSLRF